MEYIFPFIKETNSDENVEEETVNTPDEEVKTESDKESEKLEEELGEEMLNDEDEIDPADEFNKFCTAQGTSPGVVLSGMAVVAGLVIAKIVQSA